jgi:hypothetical protein
LGRLSAISTAQLTLSDEPRLISRDWRLCYCKGEDRLGVGKRFEWHAQSAAAHLGSGERGQAAVDFWLNQILQDAPKSLVHIIVSHPGHGSTAILTEVLDICGLSADYCRRCAADEVLAHVRLADADGRMPGALSKAEVNAYAVQSQPDAKPAGSFQEKRRAGKRPRVTSFDRIKKEIQQMKEAGYTQKRICDRLGSSPRPPNARWNGLPWPDALKKPEYTNSVKSWLSRVTPVT